jgi:hypothetical protein
MVYSGSIPDTPRHNKQKESVKMDSYKVIEQKLRNLEAFNGNSMRGFWDERGYNVVSYYTLIANAHSIHRELDTRYYSVTTSKHQRLIASAWGLSPLKAKKFRAVA